VFLVILKGNKDLMKKIKVMAILIALGIIFAGCNMVEVNEERDRDTVVAKVNDEVILKGQVLDEAESQINMFTMYGYYPEDFTTNPEYKDDYNSLVKNVVDVLVDSTLEEIKANEKGCYEFTEEERKELDDKIHEVLNTYINLYAEELVQDPKYADMSEDELGTVAYENLDEYFSEKNFGITTQDIVDDYEGSKAKELLRELVTSLVEVTEDEVKAEYANQVDDKKTSYADNSANFEQEANNDETLYYIPENVRKAQHILISISDEDQAEIDGYRQSGDDEKAEAKLNEALKSIEDSANEAYDRAIAGEDFIILIEEVGEDPGMDSSEYYVVKNPTLMYATEFVDGLFALENVGDISKPVETQFGYHIIKYYDNMESGPVAYDDLHNSIYDTMLTEKKDAYYQEQLNIWREEADINTYYDRAIK